MAFALGVKPLAGYPQPWGTKIVLQFDRTGPTSYATFTAPSTGGDVMNASDIGVGGLERVSLGIDTTGQIVAYAAANLSGYGNAIPSYIIYYTSLVTATLGGQAQTAGTQIASTTNLSTFSWRGEAICV